MSPEMNLTGARPQVSALLLTIGETTFQETLQAVERQTIPFDEVVIVENVSPFGSAFNEGVSRIKTPFFVQIDADMVLDPTCLAVLLSHVGPKTGMVVGYLRDSLQGRVRGVKLFRTDCCRLYPRVNRSDRELFFQNELMNGGWLVEYVEENGITLGTHEPDLRDLVYNFERFKYKGAKIGARRDWFDLAFRLAQLTRTEHPEVAQMSAVALICGCHVVIKEDFLAIFVASPEYRLWQERFTVEKSASAQSQYPSLSIFNFFAGYKSGRNLRTADRKVPVHQLFADCLCTNSVSRWAYFLGVCSAALHQSEKQAAFSMFVRWLPFLLYLQLKLSFHFRRLNDT